MWANVPWKWKQLSTESTEHWLCSVHEVHNSIHYVRWSISCSKSWLHVYRWHAYIIYKTKHLLKLLKMYKDQHRNKPKHWYTNNIIYRYIIYPSWRLISFAVLYRTATEMTRTHFSYNSWVMWESNQEQNSDVHSPHVKLDYAGNDKNWTCVYAHHCRTAVDNKTATPNSSDNVSYPPDSHHCSAVLSVKCMLYNCLEWYKWVLMNLYHSRQLYNTLIPLSHESPAVGLQTCTCISVFHAWVDPWVNTTLYHTRRPL